MDWAATNIYLVTLDFPNDKSKVPEDFQKRNRELSKAYGVRGYPTYVVLDSKGRKLGQLGASRDARPGKFIRQLCGVLGVGPEDETVQKICGDAFRREEDAYIAENRALQEKMIAHGVFFITEGNSMRGRDSFRFHLPVTRW